jgi:signal transduction histidine kinase
MLDLTGVVLENLDGVDFNLSSTNASALQLCLESLLSNAFKYGGTDVRLTIISRKTDFMITVKDNGQGMSAKQIESYGTPFNHSKTSGGTGLGVYFTLQLIK